MVAKSKLLGSVEAGGTKFVCAVADSNFNIVDQIKFKTSNPHDTLLQTINFFQKFEVSAIGVGSFGPIGIKEGYDDYG
ncbi:ROK family protein, partial [Oenococcus oeni]